MNHHKVLQVWESVSLLSHWQKYSVWAGWNCRTVATVEPLYNGHHWKRTFCPLQRGVPYSGASGIFLIGVVTCNQAVKHNVAMFPEPSLAVRWHKGLTRGSTKSSSTNLMSRCNSSSDNGQSYEQGQQMFAKLWSLSIVCIQLKCHCTYRTVGCLLFRGCFSSEWVPITQCHWGSIPLYCVIMEQVQKTWHKIGDEKL